MGNKNYVNLLEKKSISDYNTCIKYRSQDIFKFKMELP